MADWYTSREAFKRVIPKTDESRDGAIDFVIEQASREIDGLVNFNFIPKTEIRNYPWPTQNGRRTWVVPVEGDLLSVSALTKEGDDVTAIASSDFFLEPVNLGPPYNRIEIDLASTAFFSSKDTHQRQIRVAGSWGYSDTTKAASAINDAAPMSSSVTTLTVDDGALIDVGDTLLIESEQMFVSERGASHKFTVERGVNDTTAASHDDDTAVTKYVPPADVSGLCLALAIAYYEAGRGGWTGVIGGGEGSINVRQRPLSEMRDRVQRRYHRRVIGAV